MLTYIGVVIMAKMFFSMVGVIPEVHKILGSDVVGTIAAIPQQGLLNMLHPVAVIGFVSLLIMAIHPLFKIGRDQFLYFIVTLLTCIFTNLLVGVFVGIIFKFLYEFLIIGAPAPTLFKADVTVSQGKDEDEGEGSNYQIKVRQGAIFTNYLSLQRQLDKLPKGKKLVIDFSEAKVVDHTTQNALQEYIRLYGETGGLVKLVGLDQLKPYSAHPWRGQTENGRLLV
jgi:MFS superfamily sulfate permease-like transporter